MLTTKQYEGIGRFTIAFNEIDQVVEVYLPLMVKYSQCMLPAGHRHHEEPVRSRRRLCRLSDQHADAADAERRRGAGRKADHGFGDGVGVACETLRRGMRSLVANVHRYEQITGRAGAIGEYGGLRRSRARMGIEISIERWRALVFSRIVSLARMRIQSVFLAALESDFIPLTASATTSPSSPCTNGSEFDHSALLVPRSRLRVSRCT